jgi:hypothetical protein
MAQISCQLSRGNDRTWKYTNFKVFFLDTDFKVFGVSSSQSHLLYGLVELQSIPLF